MSNKSEYIEHVDMPQKDTGWIEYALQLLWAETMGYEKTADNAAEELAELRARIAELETAASDLFQACSELPLPEMNRMEKEINAVSEALKP